MMIFTKVLYTGALERLRHAILTLTMCSLDLAFHLFHMIIILYSSRDHFTWNGVLIADIAVNPAMSEKYIVTPS